MNLKTLKYILIKLQGKRLVVDRYYQPGSVYIVDSTAAFHSYDDYVKFKYILTLQKLRLT